MTNIEWPQQTPSEIEKSEVCEADIQKIEQESQKMQLCQLEEFIDDVKDWDTNFWDSDNIEHLEFINANLHEKRWNTEAYIIDDSMIWIIKDRILSSIKEKGIHFEDTEPGNITVENMQIGDTSRWFLVVGFWWMGKTIGFDWNEVVNTWVDSQLNPL